MGSCSIIDSSSHAPLLPWKEMFRAASFRLPNSNPFSETHPDPSPRNRVEQAQDLGQIGVTEALHEAASSHTPEVHFVFYPLAAHFFILFSWTI